MRSTATQQNEFNELVINLSKLDAKRFQKIMLNVEQKPTTWKTILNDLIPAAIENLFVALSPSQSKNVLTQISFLSKLNTATSIKIDTLDLYTFGIQFCIAKRNTSVSKNAFLDFVVQKLANQQRQTKLVILDRFVGADVTNTHKKTSFISLFNSLNILYQQEVSSTKKVVSEEALHRIITTYSIDIQKNKSNSKQVKEFEKTIQMWISTAPIQFWNVVRKVQKTHLLTVHITALISTYGIHRFLKQIQPETFKIVEKVQKFLDELIAKNSKKGTALRAMKLVLLNKAFEVVWNHEKLSSANFFAQLLFVLKRDSTVSTNAIEEAIELLLNYPKIKKLAWSSQEFVAIQKLHKTYTSKTDLDEVLDLLQKPNQEVIVATFVSKIVRAKETTTSEFQLQSNKIISYLLSSGIQIRERSISKFLQQISVTKTTLTSSEIKAILHDCFWQSLVAFHMYRGNERKFISLLEETIVETFPVLILEKTARITATKSIVKNQTFTTPYKISVSELFEALKENLKAGNSSFEILKTTYSYKQLFVVGLETSPTEIRTIIQETVQTKKQLLALQNAIRFEQFIALISSDLSTSKQAIFKSIHVLFILAKQLGNSQLATSLETVFWKQTIALIQTKNTAKEILEILVKTTFNKLSEIATLDQITIVKHIQNSGIKVPEILKIVLIERHQIFELVSEEIQKHTFSEAIKTCVKQQKIELLSECLITQFTIPTWFQHKEARDYRSVVNELLLLQPNIILKTLRRQQISEVQLTKFSQTVHFSTLIKSLVKLYPTQQKQLADVQKLYESIALISMNGISTNALQEILVKKVLTAWQTSNWSLIDSSRIWNEFLWETCGKKGVVERDFFKAINTIKTMLPASLLVTYKNVLPTVKPIVQTQKIIEYKNPKKTPMNTERISIPTEGVRIPNAGLVLLNNYFLMLLERLNLVADKSFKTTEDQLNAVHYFQYVVTGLTQTEESLLTLNKILSGLSPDAPIRESIEMTENEKNLIDGLIKSAIGYWSAIGDTSVNGFRGNWLVREGILRETEERWELTVEKRAYDILLMKSPFSFSIIKLPWMQKPLHVTWAY